jgi:hypothetical protein
MMQLGSCDAKNYLMKQEDVGLLIGISLGTSGGHTHTSCLFFAFETFSRIGGGISC